MTTVTVLNVRGYGPITEPTARQVAALVRAHDQKHGADIRREIRSRIASLLDTKIGDALNVARRVDRVLVLTDLKT